MPESFDSLFDPRLIPVLARLGLYERDLGRQAGFGSNIWRELGYKLTPSGDWLNYVHPEDRGRVEAAVQALTSGETDYFREEYRVRTAEGGWHWILGQGYLVSRDPDGSPRRYIGLDVDINTQKVLERFYQNAMEEAQERARETETLRRAGAIIATSLEIHHTVSLILEQAQNVIPFRVAAVLVEKDGAYEMLGITGTNREDMTIGTRFPIDDLGVAAQQMEERRPILIPDARTSDYEFLRTLRIKVGSLMAVPLVERAHVNGILVFYHPRRGTFERDHLRLGMSFADHVSIALQNARLFEQVRSQATTDSLTGLSTRRAFFAQAEAMFAQLYSVGGPITLLMVDLDHFKQVNDAYGHQEGDRLLQESARAVQSVVRENDVVGRYGGEEFAVLLRGVPLEAGMRVAERLAESIRTINCCATEGWRIASSEHDEELGELLDESEFSEDADYPGDGSRDSPAHDSNSTTYGRAEGSRDSKGSAHAEGSREGAEASAPATHLTASIGISESLTHDADSVLRLIRNADIALYAAKNAGRDRIVVYHRGLSLAHGNGP